MKSQFLIAFAIMFDDEPTICFTGEDGNMTRSVDDAIKYNTREEAENSELLYGSRFVIERVMG